MTSPDPLSADRDAGGTVSPSSPPGPFDREALGAEAAAQLERLAHFSEPGRGITRLYLTAQHRAAVDWLAGQMARAGLTTRLDAAGTLIGRTDTPTGAPTLLVGSHIDSVREGGRFDGCLGVILPLVALRRLHREGKALPYAVELVAFGDEEGVRFPVTLTGSRALAGRLDRATLASRDAKGVSLATALAAFGGDPERLAEAATDPARLIGYVEAHIEQGPVLEAEGLPVGLVTAIAAAARFTVVYLGEPGHAGTVPMGRRRDALAAAAEAVLAVERLAAAEPDAVGTVGRLEPVPGAVNVVPGEARLSLDLRAPAGAQLGQLVDAVTAELRGIASRRGLVVNIERAHAAAGAVMAEDLSSQLAAAIAAAGLPVRRLPSGAGHDAMVMAEVTPTAMLFVRCRRGLSHHPDEHASPEDMGVAIEILLRFLLDLANAPHARG